MAGVLGAHWASQLRGCRDELKGPDKASQEDQRQRGDKHHLGVFANSKEYYGTDLMGMGIWISHSRPGQAMQYMTYALSRWNEIKAAQKKKGRVLAFNNEYDATAESSDLPIHYSYMTKLRPGEPHWSGTGRGQVLL